MAPDGVSHAGMPVFRVEAGADAALPPIPRPYVVDDLRERVVDGFRAAVGGGSDHANPMRPRTVHTFLCEIRPGG